jgi:hypothetical protein
MKHSVCVCLCLAPLLVLVSCDSGKPHNPHSQILAAAEADALEAKILLNELRAGRLTNALELLEQKLDSSVILINGSLSRASDTERDGALRTLQSLKAYREAHPRRQQGIVTDSAPVAAQIEETARSANRILTELE